MLKKFLTEDHPSLEWIVDTLVEETSKLITQVIDRIDTNEMCGQPLEKMEGNNLWYQGKGYVAAGSYSVDRLMHNIRAIGFDEKAIWDMTSFVPLRACNYLHTLENSSMKPFSFMDLLGQAPDLCRFPFHQL